MALINQALSALSVGGPTTHRNLALSALFAADVSPDGGISRSSVADPSPS